MLSRKAIGATPTFACFQADSTLHVFPNHHDRLRSTDIVQRHVVAVPVVSDFYFTVALK
jgi:hypothetical protein